MDEKKYRISTTAAFQMGMVALFFDFLGLIATIPVVGTIFNWMVLAAADYAFWFWFRSKKVDMFARKNMLGIIIATILELIFGFLPAIFGQTAILTLTSWGEDKLKGGNGKGSDAGTDKKPTDGGAKAGAQAPRVPNVPTQMPTI